MLHCAVKFQSIKSIRAETPTNLRRLHHHNCNFLGECSSLFFKRKMALLLNIESRFKLRVVGSNVTFKVPLDK